MNRLGLRHGEVFSPKFTISHRAGPLAAAGRWWAPDWLPNATLLNIVPLDPEKNRDAQRLKRNRTCAARAPACDCRRPSSMDKVPTFQFQVPPASEDRNAKGSLAGMGADGLLDTQKEVRATEAPQRAPRPLARPMQCP